MFRDIKQQQKKVTKPCHLGHQSYTSKLDYQKLWNYSHMSTSYTYECLIMGDQFKEVGYVFTTEYEAVIKFHAFG